MAKKYLKKIIAQTPQDLQVISACCEGGKIKIDVEADDASNSGVRFFRFKMTE